MVVHVHSELVPSVPKQVLNDFYIVPALPQQRRIAVTKSVESFQLNAALCSDRLDEMLDHSADPERLFASVITQKRPYKNT